MISTETQSPAPRAVSHTLIVLPELLLVRSKETELWDKTQNCKCVPLLLE
jgi:hypothetical protein